MIVHTCLLSTGSLTKAAASESERNALGLLLSDLGVSVERIQNPSATASTILGTFPGAPRASCISQ